MLPDVETYAEFESEVRLACNLQNIKSKTAKHKQRTNADQLLIPVVNFSAYRKACQRKACLAMEAELRIGDLGAVQVRDAPHVRDAHPTMLMQTFGFHR